jgi:hypothetical protein
VFELIHALGTAPGASQGVEARQFLTLMIRRQVAAAEVRRTDW